VSEETIRADDGALQLIIDALEDAKRVTDALRKQAYEQQELRRIAEYRVEQFAKALGIVCSTLRMEGICNGADCGTDACSINPLCETGTPACRAVSEQQADGEESAELDREFHALLEDFDTVRAARDAAEERVEQFAQALHSVCAELRLERGCYEGECGTDACSYSDCVVGPALKLLDKLEEDTRREST
jgi:hypothetical protein